jgi:2-polyprenyl-3-methyl-5-hydroxy-6-metoxy-1,4-benzoquinol methylase
VRVSKGEREQGIVVGNSYDKYGSKNPLVRVLMHGFESALQQLVLKTEAEEIHEVGCGEGYWVLKWREEGKDARGSDFSSKVIALARMNSVDSGVSADFKVANIYDLSPEVDAAQLVVCCEVLEHLEQPERALAILSRLARPYLITSVPREPIWSMGNLLRGKYLGDLGNTPGHVQRWSKKAFLSLLERHFDIIETRSPLPWTMALCKVKKHG